MAHFEEVVHIEPARTNPLKTARLLQQLMVRLQISQSELARRVGRKRSSVANYLRLLSLPVEVQRSLECGDISMGHAKVLLSLSTIEQQRYLHARILSEKLTVKQASQTSTQQQPSPVSIHAQAVLEDLQEALGTKVEIEARDIGGRLVLHYYDIDDLQRLIERLISPN